MPVVISCASVLAALLAGTAAPARSAPLHKTLTAQGYVAVPLIRCNEDRALVVSVRIQGKPAWFLLDTGAGCTTLVPALAKRCQLETHGTVQIRSMAGTHDAQVVTFSQFEIGAVRSDYVFGVTASPLAKTLDGVLPRDGIQLEGLLGYDFLDRYAAVIDYAGATLYLLPPEIREQPPLAGKWQCVAARSHREEASFSALAGVFLESGEGRMTLTTPTKTERFFIHFLLG